MKYKYKFDLTWDSEDKIYVAHVPELDGCMSHGKTEQEALQHVKSAIESWIKTAKEFKMKVPEPLAEKEFSGTFNVRIPQAVHRQLALKASSEKVSLNHFVSYILSKAV